MDGRVEGAEFGEKWEMSMYLFIFHTGCLLTENHGNRDNKTNKVQGSLFKTAINMINKKYSDVITFFKAACSKKLVFSKGYNNNNNLII